LLARITVDPNICFGRPCIKGHRVCVALILDYLADGLDPTPLIDAEFPLEWWQEAFEFARQPETLKVLIRMVGI